MTRYSPASPLFPTQAGARLSRDAVERLVAKHATTAEAACPTIKEKNITPYAQQFTPAAAAAAYLDAYRRLLASRARPRHAGTAATPPASAQQAAAGTPA